MTYYPTFLAPDEDEWACVKLRLNNVLCVAEKDPIGRSRFQAGSMPYRHRTFLLWVFTHLKEAGGELHWSDVYREFNQWQAALHPKRKPLTRDQFWWWLEAAAMAGVVWVLVDDDWPRRD